MERVGEKEAQVPAANALRGARNIVRGFHQPNFLIPFLQMLHDMEEEGFLLILTPRNFTAELAELTGPQAWM